ncbi:MAG TPA: N-acetylmuramoyl-L-alanine amidase [Citreicella sp.]|nr:N-acetylmuramoyl-L-alanine amidase [Citreicella sp.]
MRIINHKVEGLTFQEAHYIGDVITPEIVVLHDTAGRLEKGNSAAYLASANSGKVSVQFVLERDGTVTQLVPTNRRANHAGQSSYHGRTGCNGFSIGIEIVNPGKMTTVGELGRWLRNGSYSADKGRAWWGQIFEAGGEFDIEYVDTPQHGAGVWMAYTVEQIDALAALLSALFRDIPTLKDITTHWYVSPGRKIDTNPLFPLEHIRALVLGRDDPADAAAEEGSSLPAINDMMVQIKAAGDTLNMRRWPSFNPNVIAAIPDGVVVPVIRSGSFDGRSWHLVTYAGREGWIVASYTSPHHSEPDL